MWTITFINNGKIITWVCQNKFVYEQELASLQSSNLAIVYHGASMYIREDDGEPVWSHLESRKTIEQIKSETAGKLPVLLSDGRWTYVSDPSKDCKDIAWENR